MSFNAPHDNLVLVAPRPVRLAPPVPYPSFHSTILHRPQPKPTTIRFVSSPSDALDMLKLADEIHDSESKSDYSSPAERDIPAPSPRASPRSTPPAEALEEFLSILRPSTLLFPPTSPILRPSNGIAHGFMSYRRPPSCNISPGMGNEGLGVTLLDQADDGCKENDVVPYHFKILGAGHLASPVSRTHNHFQCQPSLENSVAAFITEHSGTPSPSAGAHDASVAPAVSALSPAAVPLPLPTPDEMELESVS